MWITDRSTPARVIGLDDVTGISAGAGCSLALTTDGTVWAWGMNDEGQLGDGTMVDRCEPVRVDGICQIVAIDAGGGHSMALDADGIVWAWGLKNSGRKLPSIP
mgnify:CR=1 FL=1